MFTNRTVPEHKHHRGMASARSGVSAGSGEGWCLPRRPSSWRFNNPQRKEAPMERYIGLDVHAASCTLAVISQTGRRHRDFPVETNGQALVEAVRMIPGEKHLVFEEGLQSAWLYETLCPHVAEIVVAGITESRGQKSDKRDAYG